MRARYWHFSRFAEILEPWWYILPPGLFVALKLKKMRKIWRYTNFVVTLRLQS